jgi:hypothetical protein
MDLQYNDGQARKWRNLCDHHFINQLLKPNGEPAARGNKKKKSKFLLDSTYYRNFWHENTLLCAV